MQDVDDNDDDDDDNNARMCEIKLLSRHIRRNATATIKTTTKQKNTYNK